jgi:hypothetical protein
MASYQGYKSWAQWNVSLWINNDEGLYNMARDYIRHTKTRQNAAESMLETLQGFGIEKTPDGARYSVTGILSAMRGM